MRFVCGDFKYLYIFLLIFAVTSSEEFEDFLHVLGDTIELKGWTGYRGGLDEKGIINSICS